LLLPLISSSGYVASDGAGSGDCSFIPDLNYQEQIYGDAASSNIA
jgi:hypothetical protein